MSRTSASGTWCERHVPSTGLPSTSFGPVQPFGVRRTSIGQWGRSTVSPRRALALDLGDPVERLVERGGESPMHGARILAVEATGDEQRLPPVALEERHQLLLRDPREHRRARDLVAVEVQDRQHGAVRARVEELVRVPARRQRPGLRLPVADDADDDQLGIVEGRAERVDECVAELAAFVDRARRLGGGMARDAAWERELPEQPAEPFFVLRDVRIQLRVRAFEVGVRDVRGPAVAGAGDEDRVEVALADRAVQVRVDEVEARRRAEMAEQPRLDVLRRSGSRRSGLSSR